MQFFLFKASSENGCNLHSYMLNREPTEVKYLRTLIDTTHFKGHKKTQKDKNGRCGHTGCSRGYDSASYKQTMPAGFMTQGREQRPGRASWTRYQKQAENPAVTH